ncbi:MAG: PTS system mannose/fructose/sorbose family transporter subunit IID [Symbiobacterium sp.]|uniref:PTS system mannose/fructose/sorbose family transporter subunit IID n=1 Tax=Symbiobacterium sp. TaxID=1971213 RepID=UPI0034640249
MAFSIPDQYKDLTPAEPLDKATLNRMAWRSVFLQASFNYERMQSAGWLYSILPGLQKIHKNKDDLAASMSHNLEFFNTHPFLVTFVMGIVLSLEQNKADINTIRAVRVSAMGPLGGIGDAIFWFTLVPIAAGITSNMALTGNIAAPFVFLLIFNAVQFLVRFWLMHWSYQFGTDAIKMFTANAKQFTRAASILGVFVVGALTCLYGGTTVNINIPNGSTYEAVPITTVVSAEELSRYTDLGATVQELTSGDFLVTYNEYNEVPVTINIQQILDGIVPKLIPLALTLFLYFMFTKKGWTPLKAIGFLLLLGLVGSGFGLWPSIW